MQVNYISCKIILREDFSTVIESKRNWSAICKLCKVPLEGELLSYFSIGSDLLLKKFKSA